jgi:tRNA (guanosine-2'-O-)-methyltransferase
MEDFMSKMHPENFLEYITPERLKRMRAILEERTRYLTIVMENLYDPRNTSAVIRSAEAYGFQDFHIVELDNPFQVSRRVSQGAHSWVNLYKYKSSKQAIDNLHKNGYKVYFADPRPQYPDLDELPLDQKTALIFGQEKQGITPETRELADGGFRIPLYGFVESFNVSVACAISISHLSYRLRKAPPQSFFLSPGEKEKIFQHWLIKNTLIGNILKKNGHYRKYALNEPYLIRA